MEQIITHPLYIRCRKVIESCETNEQLKVAIKYCKLAVLRDTFDHHYYFDSLIYDANRMLWKSLVEEVKWNLMKCKEYTMKH